MTLETKRGYERLDSDFKMHVTRKEDGGLTYTTETAQLALLFNIRDELERQTTIYRRIERRLAKHFPLWERKKK